LLRAAGGGLGILVNTMGIYLAPVDAELDLGRGPLAVYMTILGVTKALTMSLAGRLLPTMNLRLLVSGGFVVVIAAYGAMSQFTSVTQWYVAGAVMGFGGAFVFLLPTPVMISQWFVRKRGLATGVAMALSGLGAALAATVGASFIESYGWRTTHLLLAAISAVVVLPFTVVVIRYRPQDLGLLPYGASEVAEPTEAQSAAGVPDRAAWGSPVFWFAFLAAGLPPSLSKFLATPRPSATAQRSGEPCSPSSWPAPSSAPWCWAPSATGSAHATARSSVSPIATGCVLVAPFGDGMLTLTVGAFMIGGAVSMTLTAAPLLTGALFGARDYSRYLAHLTMTVSLLSSLAIAVVGFT